MPGSQHRLEPQQQLIPPRPQLISILRVQRRGAVAVRQIPVQVKLPVDLPRRVRRREIGDAQPDADSVKYREQLPLLRGGQRSREQLVRSLRVVDEHVQHVAVRPVGNSPAALGLDGLVRCPDPLERARCGQHIGEDDVLRVCRRGKKPADRIGRQLPREEQPVNRAIQRELGGGAGENEQHHVAVPPDPAHDGARLHEIDQPIALSTPHGISNALCHMS